MARDRKLNRLIFILALIFMGVRINLIGSISLTEIYVLLQTPILIKWVVNSSLPYLKTLCVLFLALILVQALSEYMVQNSFVNAVRGIAITIMALLLFLFLFAYNTDVGIAQISTRDYKPWSLWAKKNFC